MERLRDAAIISGQDGSSSTAAGGLGLVMLVGERQNTTLRAQCSLRDRKGSEAKRSEVPKCAERARRSRVGQSETLQGRVGLLL